MDKSFLSVVVGLVFCTVNPMAAQESITNAFDDLSRTGIVNENLSEMRRAASAESIKVLLAEKPAAGYFCFVEDREHDIRRSDSIPVRWVQRTPASRLQLDEICRPGEFYTWQIGVYAPYEDVEQLSVRLIELKDMQGKKIPVSSFTCFNLSGISTDGKPLKKSVSVRKGEVQALWMGVEVPRTAKGSYKGTVMVCDRKGRKTLAGIKLVVKGEPVNNSGDNEGWRKTHLRWLNSTIGNEAKPTAPYPALREVNGKLEWLGGSITLNGFGLPSSITTCYTPDNALDVSAANAVLASDVNMIIETTKGKEILKGEKLRILRKTSAEISWISRFHNSCFKVDCTGTLGFDGIINYRIGVTSLKPLEVKDIRLEVPYTVFASKYMMGLGRKGGCRPDSLISWKWDVDKHQDKVWMGNVNAGLDLHFMDEAYVRPLVNIYYSLGKLVMPKSWGNQGKGGN